MQRKLSTVMTHIHSATYVVEWDVKNPLDLFCPQKVCVPISIFSTNMPVLQALVLYLRDYEFLPFSHIAQSLGRAESTIRVTYRNASKFSSDSSLVLPTNSPIVLPIGDFASPLSPLEVVVSYLRTLQFRNVDVARMLSLDPRTTSTILRRIKMKEGLHE